MGAAQSAIVNWNVSLCAAADSWPNRSQFEWYQQECPDMPGYFSTQFRIIATTIQSLIFFVGLFGNLMVILVVKRTRSMHTPTNCYLVSLSMADLLLLVTAVPEAVWSYYQLGMRWGLGSYMCSLAVFLQYLAVNVSALSIFAFTVERYVAVCHPLHAQKICTIQRALRIIVGIWISGILYCIPWLYLATTTPLIYRGIEPLEQCRHRLRREHYIIYYFFDLVLFYVLPLILIIIMYARIAIYLVHSGEQLRATRGGQLAPPVPSSVMMMMPLQRKTTTGRNSDGLGDKFLPASSFKRVHKKRQILSASSSATTSGVAPASADVSSANATLNSGPQNSTSGGGISFQSYPYDQQQNQSQSTISSAARKSEEEIIKQIDGDEEEEVDNRSSSGGDMSFHSNDDSARSVNMTTTRARVKKTASLTSEHANGSPPVNADFDVKETPGEEDRRGSYQQYANGYRAVPKLSTASTQKSASAFQARVRVIQMLVIVTVMFAVLWLPYRALMVYNSLAPMFGRWKLDDLWVLLFAKTLIYMNSSINPILYNALSLKFRRAFRCLLTCQSSERANMEARHRRHMALSQEGRNNARHQHRYRMPPQQQQQHIISPDASASQQPSLPYSKLSAAAASVRQQDAALLCVPANQPKLSKSAKRRQKKQERNSEGALASSSDVVSYRQAPHLPSVPDLDSRWSNVLMVSDGMDSHSQQPRWISSLSAKGTKFGKRPDLLQSVAE